MNYIEVNGEQLPVKFGYKVVRKAMSKHKLKKWNDWVQIPTLTEFDDVPDILLGALQSGAKTAGEDCTLTRDDVEDILDSHPHLVTQMWEIFIDDMTPADKKETVKAAIDEATEKAVAEEVEKNRVGIVSNE
jgi:hypothetical protein